MDLAYEFDVGSHLLDLLDLHHHQLIHLREPGNHSIVGSRSDCELSLSGAEEGEDVGGGWIGEWALAGQEESESTTKEQHKSALVPTVSLVTLNLIPTDFEA